MHPPSDSRFHAPPHPPALEHPTGRRSGRGAIVGRLFSLSKARRWGARVIAAVLVTMRLPMPAETVVVWNLDRGNAPTAGVNTGTVTVGDGSSNSADNVAVSGMLSGTLSMVVPADMILMEGSVTLDGISTGNTVNQFDFGLFNSNGSTGSKGWLGYAVEASDGTGSGTLLERSAGNNADYYSTSGTSSRGSYRAAGNADFLSGTYHFSLQLTRLAGNALGIAFSLTSSLGYSMTGTYTDTTVQTFSYNRVGFTIGNGLNADQVTLSGVTVNYIAAVPEPGCTTLLALGALGLGLRRRRRR